MNAEKNICLKIILFFLKKATKLNLEKTKTLEDERKYTAANQKTKTKKNK